MGFGPFVLISLFYGVLALRVVAQLARSWRPTFDRRFTPQDRSLVDQAAFFVLVPIAVALHELGHAIAVWAYGGRVVSWGYYGFAGFVGYDPTDFSPTQRIVVSAAGTVVNLLLAGGALAFVFLRRPPLRAAFNELLLQFVFISLLNALVVYPLLDLSSGLNGDWRQMYFGGVPSLSAVILAVHLGVLAALFWGWRDERVRTRIAALTGNVPGPRRSSFAASPGSDRPGAATAADPTDPTELALRDAASRVAAGWPHRLEASLQRRDGGVGLALEWREGDLRRGVVAWAPAAGPITLDGILAPVGAAPDRRSIALLPPPHDADRLTLALRLALERVAGWSWRVVDAPGGAT
jgi:hypothetical protein